MGREIQSSDEQKWKGNLIFPEFAYVRKIYGAIFEKKYGNFGKKIFYSLFQQIFMKIFRYYSIF